MAIIGISKNLTIKKIIRFGKKEKVKFRYIGLFEILKQGGTVACPLALPPQLSSLVGFVFSYSNANEYEPDLSLYLNINHWSYEKI